MNRLGIIGAVIVIAFVLVALFAPWIATQDVGATNLSIRYRGPTAAHWFGTDSTGRDIFSRVVFGARISLQVGMIVVSVSAVVNAARRAGRLLWWLDRSIHLGLRLQYIPRFPWFAARHCNGRISWRWLEQTHIGALHHR